MVRSEKLEHNLHGRWRRVMQTYSSHDCMPTNTPRWIQWSSSPASKQLLGLVRDVFEACSSCDEWLHRLRDSAGLLESRLNISSSLNSISMILQHLRLKLDKWPGFRNWLVGGRLVSMVGAILSTHAMSMSQSPVAWRFSSAQLAAPSMPQNSSVMEAAGSGWILSIDTRAWSS